MTNWTDEMIKNVWEKGKVAKNNVPSEWRKDECGAWIGRNEYGDRNSEYGWEIDHISPGGKDILSNLRPLQWENNVDKCDGRLKCNIISNGTKNVNS